MGFGVGIQLRIESFRAFGVVGFVLVLAVGFWVLAVCESGLGV